MYSFGKVPPRALQSFGVAGLLGEDCKIFYSSLFSARHVGRVSDLLTAQLGPMKLDELRLRALLLFTFFEAYRAQGSGAGGLLAEPLTVECGTDSEKVAIGISFAVSQKGVLDPTGLVDRLAKGPEKNAFEALLRHVHAHSDCMIVRWQPGALRAEVVALLGIPGKISPANTRPIEVVVLDRDPGANKLKTTAYIELGDLDYPNLLKEESPGSKLPPPPSGEILAKQSRELEEAIRLRAQGRISEDITRITGVTAKTNDETAKVAGVARKANDELTRVAGAGGRTKEQVVRIKGQEGYEAELAALRLSSDNLLVESYEDKIKFLEDKIMQLQLSRGAGQEGEAGAGQGGFGFGGLLAKVWPFKKKGEEQEEEDTGSESVTQDGNTKTPAAAAGDESAPQTGEAKTVADAKSKTKEAADNDPRAATDAKKGDDAKAAQAAANDEALPPPVVLQEEKVESSEAPSSKLVVEIETGNLQKVITKAEQDMVLIRQELSASPNTKRWVDSLMSELVAEKARLAETAKKLNQNVRQKEFEFRSREQVLKEGLARTEEALRQRTSALGRAKEQIAQASMNMERLKTAAHRGSEDAHAKHKLETTQRMLAVTRTENTQLSKKIEDLKEQLAVAQLAATKKGKANEPDVAAVQAQCERLQRQVDEFKKANIQLMDKLSKSKKDSATAANVEEMKKRMDAAMKLVGTSKKDSERLQLRVEELEREEKRLKAELHKSSTDLKRAQKPGGSGQGPGQGQGAA